MKFEAYRFSSNIKKSLVELGFVRPTDIQFKAIPSILKKEDVLAIAQTGTGKTAAFAIPIIELIYSQRRNNRYTNVTCVVMEPTRELVIQTSRVFREIGKYTDIEILGVLGGVEQDPQIAKLGKGVDIIIATPGRLFDLISQGHIHLNHLQILVLDEADHMLDLGFIKDIRQLMHHLPQYRQTLFFSATINPEIKELAYSLVNKPVRIQISPKDPVSKNIDHYVSFVEMDDKRFFLERFIREHENEKILIFVRTKVRAERVKSAMQRVEIVSDTIHGDKTQQERNAVVKKFSANDLQILIATDISARGIDIPNIQYVINYDIPLEPETYVHRIGRTGRGTKRGTAISFCSAEEKEALTEIETLIGKEIANIEIAKSEYAQTIDTSLDTSKSLQEIIKEIEAIDNKRKKKRK